MIRFERKIYEQLNFTSDSLKIHSCKSWESGSTLFVNLEILLLKKLEQNEREEILNILHSALGSSKVEISIKEIINHFDKDICLLKIRKFLEKNSSFLNAVNNKMLLSYKWENSEIIISTTKTLGDYIEKSMLKDLEAYVYRSYLNKLNLTITKDQEEEEYEKPFEVQKTIRGITVTELLEVKGCQVEGIAKYIVDIDKEEEKALLAGWVENLEMKDFKEVKGKRNPHYFTFTLNDTTGKIRCVVFPSKTDHNKFLNLDKQSVILEGNISINSYQKDYQVMVDRLSRCQIKPFEIASKPLSQCPESYNKIFPEKVTLYKQNDLFASDEPSFCKHLMGKTMVCVDLETTGLNPLIDRIIEIGAVKIENGRITEKFSTLVNPKRLIPRIVEELTGINNEIVENAPVIEEVFKDFYKFSYDAVLFGHNFISFDWKFLLAEANRQKLVFANRTEDTLPLARRLVPTLNNHKLGTLCSHFGVENENAHRAYEDAITTAQIYFKLMELKNPTHK